MAKVTNLCAYSTFIHRLNGRFGHLLSSKKVKAVDDLNDINDSVSRSARLLWVVAILAAIWTLLYKTPDAVEVYRRLVGSADGLPYLLIGKFLFLTYCGVFGWRLWLVWRYRPAAACRDEELLPCTVIVPAYNEGRHVLHTLRSVVRSDIPADKLQIIAVDDGSKDDTWRWIQKAVKSFPGRIEAVRMPQNGGKRKALYEGFLRSKGEAIVTIDSDSLIEPHTIRRLISPICRDPKVGAVAGCVRVLNLHQGFIPRMLDVAFAFSFDFHRASQSEVDSVLCTPGALSAYRRGPLMANAAAWLNQTFMGRLSTIGEDRAMTNYILKDGYGVKFQSDAIVYTNVPTRYKQLCKMLLRWARSNVRETIFMAQFVFRRFRQRHLLGARINFFTGLLDTFLPRLLLVVWGIMLLGRLDVWGMNLLAGALVATAAQGGFYFLRRRSLEAVWAFPYSIFSALALSWIAVYAIFTASNGKWLTRDIAPTEKRPDAQNAPAATAA